MASKNKPKREQKKPKKTPFKPTLPTDRPRSVGEVVATDRRS